MDSVNLLLDKLKDPDASSSLAPLIIVLTILFVIAVITLFKAIPPLLKLRKIRFKVDNFQAPIDPPDVIYLNVSGKFRYYFRRLLRVPVESNARDLAEIQDLRKQIQRLEEALNMERTLHGRAVARIGELKGERESQEEANDELRKLLEVEIARRKKFEEKAERLEMQLKDAIAETERLYNQTAKLAESHAPVPINALLKDFPPPPKPDTAYSGEELVARQAAEIEQLKNVLRQCKERMLDMEKGRPGGSESGV